MTRLAGLAALVLGLLVNVVAVPVVRAEDEAAMREALARMAADIPAMERHFALLFKPLPDGHLRALAEHTRDLLAEDEFFDLVIEVAKPLAAAGADDEAMMEKGAEVAVGLQLRGFARLPSDRQEEFLRHSAAMFRWLAATDPATCKDIAAATTVPPVTEMQRVEYEYLATLPAGEMAAVLRLYRDAILAELRELPPSVELTAARRDAAMFAYSNRLMARFSERSFPTLSLETMDFAAASAEDVCAFTVLSMEALFELTGNERVWLLQEFVEAMDDPL